MAENSVGSPQQPEEKRPDVYTRLNNAFKVEDRDWHTVSRRVATRMLAGGGATLAVFAAGIAGFRATYASKIYPNTRIGDVNVGGMTAEQATAAVQKRVDELNTTSVHFTYNDLTWSPTLAELGVTVDVPAAVSNAMDLGRDARAADRLMHTNEIMQETQVVPLKFEIQPSMLTAWFDTVDSDIANPAINATFTVQGADLVITQDSTGIVSDRDTISTRVLEALRSLQPVKGELPTLTDFPRITKADLEANEAAVLAILSNSVTVRFEDKRWEVMPEDVSTYMMFNSEVENGRAVTSVDFDRNELADYLKERFRAEVNRMPVNASVQFFQGQLSATSNSISGKTLKAPEFAELVANSFLGNHERVDVPVVTTPAKVREDNLDALGIKERICRVDSNFSSDLGTDREHNVMVGVNLINNTIVAPGDDFSFNTAVGSIEANPDFRGGTGIVAGVIQDEFGGGICQVTTTAFRAAIMGGFPVTEWYPHSYRLTGYERDGWGPGYDASILQPEWQTAEEWADFRFTNNTDNFILISSWADSGIHIIEVWGTNPGWNVELSETITWEAEPSDKNAWVVDYELPAGSTYASAWPVDGLYASFTRTVYDAEGKEMYVREFTSPYQARGWQCTCSADMEGVPCW
jgi:vancomycin resistance protein YoaR